MKAFTFSDVLIKPKYSEIDSRKDIDISSNFGPFKLDLPVIAANMKTICGPKMAIEMRNNGGLGILHRFCSIKQAVEDFEEVKNFPNLYKGIGFMDCCGVSIGVQEEDKERFDKLYEAGARIFCLDLAHGHCKKMKEKIAWIKQKNLDVYLIAGNIATSEAAIDFCEWGVNAIKINIGPGAACMTRRNVGVGVPVLYALQSVFEAIECFNIRPKIISDGGIKFVGDASKALRYCDSIMIGSFISGSSETPGNVFRDENNQYYKVYMGSASGEGKISNGQADDYVEGIALKVPFRGHVKHILKEIKQGLQSAFSYTNSRNLEEFHKNCEFIEITSGGKEESKI